AGKKRRMASDPRQTGFDFVSAGLDTGSGAFDNAPDGGGEVAQKAVTKASSKKKTNKKEKANGNGKGKAPPPPPGAGTPSWPPPPNDPATSLAAEARTRYLNYALSVITSRAL